MLKPSHLSMSFADEYRPAAASANGAGGKYGGRWGTAGRARLASNSGAEIERQPNQLCVSRRPSGAAMRASLSFSQADVAVSANPSRTPSSSPSTPDAHSEQEPREPRGPA